MAKKEEKIVQSVVETKVDETEAKTEAQPAPQPAPEAQAQPETETKADPAAERLTLIAGLLADIDKKVLEAHKARDFKAMAALSEQGEALEAERVEIALTRDINSLVPMVVAACAALPAPEGRFVVSVVFEAGRAVSASRFVDINPGPNRVAAGTAKATEAKQQTAKANLVVGPCDVRTPPKGWTFTFSSNGAQARKGQWVVTSMGDGNYVAVQGEYTITGSGNTVASALKGTAANVNAEFKLGDYNGGKPAPFEPEAATKRGWKAPL